MSLITRLMFRFKSYKFEVAIKGKDGKEYVADTLEVGKELYVKTDDTTIVIVPDGTYEMEDGSIVEVKDGVIASITPMEQEDKDEKLEGENKPETESKFDAENEIKTLRDEIENLKKAILDVANEKEVLKKEKKELTDTVEKLSKEPAEKSLLKKDEKISEKKMDPTVKYILSKTK